MDPKHLIRIKNNIEHLKKHFRSSDCLDELLPESGPEVLEEMEKILLSQDAYIRNNTNHGQHNHMHPGQHNSALFQAKRLVEMLERNPP